MKPNREFRPGMRVRAKVRTICGWKGTGTVIEASGCWVRIKKDYAGLNGTADFLCDELAVMRDQTPSEDDRLWQLAMNAREAWLKDMSSLFLRDRYYTILDEYIHFCRRPTP